MSTAHFNAEFRLKNMSHSELLTLATKLAVTVKKSAPKYELVEVLKTPYETYLEAKQLEKKLAEEAAEVEKTANKAQAISDRLDHETFFDAVNKGLNESLESCQATRQKFLDYATKYNDIAGAIRHHGESAAKAEARIKTINGFVRMLNAEREEPITFADLPVRMTAIMENCASSLVSNCSTEAETIISYRTQYKVAEAIKVAVDRYLTNGEKINHFWINL